LDITKINSRLLTEFDKNFKNENPNIKFAIFCFINDVKIDLVHDPHRLIKPIEIIKLPTPTINPISIPTKPAYVCGII
jgi:hypothetical protein